jgi:hypothetical protein
MHLAATHFTKIEGTQVSVHVKSAEEGRAALKELRHKKREISHVRKMLQRQQKEARERHSAASDSHKRAKKMGGLVGVLVRAAHKLRLRKPARALADIDKDLENLGTLSHNIDSCILQIEGKLLADADKKA